MTTYYQATANSKPGTQIPVPNSDYDICILGAGITGLSAALRLSQSGLKVAVFEQEEIGHGGSGRSGGQILAGYNESIDDLAKAYGQQAALDFHQASVQAMSLTRDRIKQQGINCDLSEGALYLARTPAQARALEQQYATLKKAGANVQLETSGLAQHIQSEHFISGLYDADSGHLHPLNYTLGLANLCIQQGVEIFEHCRIYGLTATQTGWQIQASELKFYAHKILLAGNALAENLLPGLNRSILPVWSHIIATRPLKQDILPSNAACSDSEALLSYFRRTPDNRLLFGGRPGPFDRSPDKAAQILQGRISKFFPQLEALEIEYHWGGYVGVTLPQIPRLANPAKNAWVAHGYSGHGMALSGFAGDLVARAMMDNVSLSPFDQVRHWRFPASKTARIAIAQLGMLWKSLF